MTDIPSATQLDRSVQTLVAHECKCAKGVLKISRRTSRSRILADCRTHRSLLLQLCVLCFGLLQDGDARIRVFPEGKEILVSSEGADPGGVGIGAVSRSGL